MLRDNLAITRLDVQRFSDADSRLLAQALEHNSTLEALRISNIDADCIAIVPALARTLCTNRALTKLDIYCSFNDGGLTAVAGAIAMNHTLRQFKLLAENPIVVSPATAVRLETVINDSDHTQLVDVQIEAAKVVLVRKLTVAQSVLHSTVDKVWRMTDDDCIGYQAQVDPNDLDADGRVSGQKAHDFLRRVGRDLSDAQLRSIWLLVDVDGDSRLDQGEQTTALHLIAGARDYQRQLPMVLPRILRPILPSPPCVRPWHHNRLIRWLLWSLLLYCVTVLVSRLER